MRHITDNEYALGRVTAVTGVQIADNLRVLSESPTITYAGLTGSPFTRLAQLDATAKTLQRSLPIAAAAALVLLLIVMRSLRYAVVTIIPIGPVVVRQTPNRPVLRAQPSAI